MRFLWNMSLIIMASWLSVTSARGPWVSTYLEVMTEAALRLSREAEPRASPWGKVTGPSQDAALRQGSQDLAALLPRDLELGPWGWLQRVSNLGKGVRGGEELEEQEDTSREGEGEGEGERSELPASSLCGNDTGEVLLALTSRADWAKRMLDASAKPPSGVLEGRAFWVGEYGECRGVHAVNLSRDPSPPLSGQYCTAILPLEPGDARPLMPGADASGVRIGLCMPSTCAPSDVTRLLNSALRELNSSLSVGLTICQLDAVEWDAKAIAAVVVAGILLVLIVAGTSYDVIVMQVPVWRHDAAREGGGGTSEGGGDTREGGGGTRRGGAERDDPSVNLREGKSGEYTPLLPSRSRFYQPTAGRGGQLLLAFSVYTNGRKLLSTSQPPGSLPCLHGIRFLSMTWVILGHTLAFGVTLAENLPSFLHDVTNDVSFQAISNAVVAVDTFFCLSGTLVVYLILRELDKTEGKMNWFMFYFHRFWRLTPPYMLILFFDVALFAHWGEGPNWPQGGAEINNCSDTWWTNLLYVNNLIKPKEMCMTWSWYLANDMQLYVISPLIFMPLFHAKRFGVAMLAVALLVGVVTPGAVSSYYQLPPSMEVPGIQQQELLDYFVNYYVTPWCRMGPYVVGMATGYLLHRTRCKIMMSKTVALIGWCLATGSALAVLYGLYDVNTGHVMTTEVSALYNSLARSVWGAAVAWVIVACVTGYGGPVNTLLSWSALVPLSRLTYCAYLIHPIIMNVYYFSRNRLINFTDLTLTHLFLGHLVATYAVSVVCSLAFEAPAMALEKALLRTSPNRERGTPMPNGAAKSSGF